jgi:hypothetical protein
MHRGKFTAKYIYVQKADIAKGMADAAGRIMKKLQEDSYSGIVTVRAPVQLAKHG